MSGICKYFQTNSCRFGNKCRFRHVYEEQQQQQYVLDNRNKPSGVSILKSNPANNKNTYYAQPREETDLKKLTEDVAVSVKDIEQGVWPLTCIGVVPSCGNIEGFEDLSPEELRWKAYEARANGKFDAYVEETQMILRKAAAFRSVFIGKGPTAQSILNSYLANASKKDPNTTNTNTSVFGSPSFHQTQNTTSMFGFQQDFRAHQPPSAAFSSNIFAQALNDSPNEMQNNIFAQAIQPMQRNIFGQAVDMQEPIQSNFVQNHASPGNNIFKQNIFANALQSTGSPSSFFQSQPSKTVSFAQPNVPSQGNGKQVSVNVLYSRIEDLNSAELEQYKSNTFTYGKTPLKPPPKELC